MILGRVTDDFIGADGTASFLQAGGANVILSNGIPEREDKDILETQAMAIALKTRTCPLGGAVDRSMATFPRLKTHGVRMLYFKYCSTFDSTENGNMSPVLGAAPERWDIPYTLLYPVSLENGGGVKDGKLYVNGVLLEDSPMKDHPLNPMRDSRLKYLTRRQSRYPYFNLGVDGLGWGFRPYRKPGHYHLIPNYYEGKYGRMIAKQYGNLPLLSGGSGLLKITAHTWEPDEERNILTPLCYAALIILVGSCSEVARTQVRYYGSKGGASLRIHPLRFVQGIQTVEYIRVFLGENKDQAVLAYTSTPPSEANRTKAEWRGSYPPLEYYNEELLTGTAAYALESGGKGIVAAGRETSGVVIQKPEMYTFHIGRSTALGVPVIYPTKQGGTGLILKSDDFGQGDFFIQVARDI